MSGKKKSRLKSSTFSFKDRGQLSHGKDLDVQYVTHKKIMKKNRKSTWVESCADPRYDTGPSPTSSPHKRVKHHHEGPDSIPGDVEREIQKIQDDKLRQTQNDFIHEYLNYRDLFLDVILESEDLANEGLCECCQSQEGLFRCLTCSGDHAWCHACILEAHKSLPFHKMQEWNGKCFGDTSLMQMGYIWHLGHGGRPCPSSQGSWEWEDLDVHIDNQVEGTGSHIASETSPPTTSLTIVHSTGVFTHNILWCHCPGSLQQSLQLLKAGLFPASISRPRTAFTFDALDNFLIDALECKTSASSFFQKLRRLTNNAFPDTVPDRYRELMRVSRQWRDLMNRKRFGFGHSSLIKPGPGNLALFCAACPQPGINMPLHWRHNWLIMQRYVVDGNFTAQHMNMRQPHLDVSLSDGLGYMVTEAGYQAHLSSAMESKDWWTSRRVNGCQWCIHFAERVANCTGLSLPEHSRVLAAVGAGQVDGEILETLWASFNKISPTARSMSQYHRQEILDDHMRDSNWKKLVGLVKTLLKKHKRAIKGISDTKPPFDELTRSLDDEKIAIWENDEMKAMEERGEYLDIYQLKIDQAPTMAEIRLRLTEAENAETGRLGTVSWIIQGINLEDAQDGLRSEFRRLPSDATATQKATLEEKRQKISARITAFHETADAMTEGIELEAGTVHKDDARFCWAEDEEHDWEAHVADLEDDSELVDDEISAEDMGLWMPSSVLHDQVTSAHLLALQAEELELRRGQANDCLEKIRLALGDKAVIYRQHFRSADSVWTGTRSKQEAQRCRIKIDKYVRSYQRARSAMERLGMDRESLETVYQEILAEQLSIDKEVTEENRFGQGSDKLAWFWRVNNGKQDQTDTWMDEFYRVNWLKAKARWNRWEEELSLVQHEMGWTVSWFKYQEEKWQLRWHQATKPGHQPYAHKQVLVWKAFTAEAEEKFKDKLLIMI
ncbi:hypothetical protein DEU56DRAFT_762242 [Suillus clintonianus]|uniref:uncharacterized protein n=1 Tax=Suillus clintonianus TaxID=1904413 RepID=UPI001B878877|nr:uncharacterized protein DEU56DRAFT_762242 [Suillus clintonianus]KAG2111109.1 hypothetical protein DEU56DRAFT_762242 [Suillus clintonianus]